MIAVPQDLRQRLQQHDQEHVLHWWDELSDQQRQSLLAQLQSFDLEQLRQLHTERDATHSLPPLDSIAPLPHVRPEKRLATPGEEALRRGEVAVLLVAGGQGTRLGFEHAKGMFPVGPVSGHSLYQIHAEKVLALGRRYGRLPPMLIMTSEATHAESKSFFEEHGHFGLPAEEVFFFQQGTMPAVDFDTGKLLMEDRGRVFTSPNGHGGVLAALRDHGLLTLLRERGIRQIYYFQVDNPLVSVADPLFLGHHLEAGAQVSSRVVPKQDPADKMGNMVIVDGRCAMIEYSDLPPEWGEVRDEGKLRFWAGNTAIHLFALDFLELIAQNRAALPFHLAKKKVPYLDQSGKTVEPEEANGLKFEMFIFDILPLTERWTAVETSRREEFEPLKNAEGPDSPETVRAGINRQVADWLHLAGVHVPLTAEGKPAVDLEVCPLFALDAEELAAKIASTMKIEGSKYFC